MASTKRSDGKGKPPASKGTPVWQFLQLEEWIKEVLMLELVDGNSQRALEFNCGKGYAQGKWARASIGVVVCFDPQAENISRAKWRWVKRGEPYPSVFLQHSLFFHREDTDVEATLHGMLKDLRTRHGEGRYPGWSEQAVKAIGTANSKYQLVASFHGLDDAFMSQATAEAAVSAVSTRLQIGGYFFGCIPDSSTIWYRGQKGDMHSRELKSFSDKLFKVNFDRVPDDADSVFGHRFSIKYADGQVKNHVLVHIPTFIKLCHKVGLQVIAIDNYRTFYDAHKFPFRHRLLEMGVIMDKNKKILDDQMKLADLYTTFLFQRIPLPLS
mmetsp:Transcript_18383/g.51883  ORF Transcript_18383/g.51883 Transcript_18383/m.51883 type:complete len:326 (+) Transcript_18383:41-1018(+)